MVKSPLKEIQKINSSAKSNKFGSKRNYNENNKS